MSEFSTPGTDERTRNVAVPVELVPQVLRLIEGAGGRLTADTTIDYAGTTPRARRGWVDGPTAVAMLFLAAVFTFLTVVMVPRFEEIFKDFGTKLPTPTVAVLIVSRFVGRDYGWVVVWALAAGIPVLVARLRPKPARGRAWGLSIFVAVVVGTLAIFMTYALMVLPMVTLIQSVSEGPAKR